MFNMTRKLMISEEGNLTAILDSESYCKDLVHYSKGGKKSAMVSREGIEKSKVHPMAIFFLSGVLLGAPVESIQKVRYISRVGETWLVHLNLLIDRKKADHNGSAGHWPRPVTCDMP